MPQKIELPKSVEEAIAQGWEYDCADAVSDDQQMTAVGIAVFKGDDLEFLAPFTCHYTYEVPRWKVSEEERKRIFDRDPGAATSAKA